MCFFGSARRSAPPKPEFKDSPPVVTGSQTGVASPKNTLKATEQLKIKRKQKEASKDSNTSTKNPGDSLNIPSITSGSSNSNSLQSKRASLTSRKKTGS
tara:strand:- start:688 stop:984 length:297 start_codon:yes stop_codon:yes gene_type:complete